MFAGARLRLPKAIRKKIWFALIALPLILYRICDPFLLTQSVKEASFNVCAGTICSTAAQGARFVSALYSIAGERNVAKEFALAGRLFDLGARRSLKMFFKPSTASRIGPHSCDSWSKNQKQLSQIPASTRETKELVHFLEKRWLAKANGFYPFIIDWLFPCFDMRIQVHPDTAPTYARDQWTASSNTYLLRREAWKKSLCLSQDYPLILTRPYDFQQYLPSYFTFESRDEIFSKMAKGERAFLDITPIFSSESKHWDFEWMAFHSKLTEECSRQGWDSKQLVCLHRIQGGGLGVLRVLGDEQHHQFLLEWISRLGFIATQVELDREAETDLSSVREAFRALGTLIQAPSKELFLADVAAFETHWKTESPVKKLMLQGSLQILKGLFASLSKQQWDQVIHCPTRSGILKLAFSNIKDQLVTLDKVGEGLTIFDFIMHVEQIHSHLTHLIEILSPFESGDFSPICSALLTTVPSGLKPLAEYTVHSTAMASLAGIYKAVEKSIGRVPRVLYGENAYFENIMTSHWVSKAYSMDEIKEADWGRIDLILAQFNPALKRVGLDPINYKVENISATLRKALDARLGNPVTLALDCTIDFINSPRVERLLETFQKEIEEGDLNVICYRSGLKYDLFGMDHFAGAPFYMIHSQDPKWSAFASLLSDPALETDRLSFNWFCLAYKYAAPSIRTLSENHI